MTMPSSGDQPAYVDPVTGAPLFVDPVTGQLVYTDPTIPSQTAYPPLSPYPTAAPTYPGYTLPAGFPPVDPANSLPPTGYPTQVPPQGFPPVDPASGVPATGYTAPQFPPPGYGYPGYGYPMQAVRRGTNSMALTSMIMAIVGAPLLFCDDIGGLLGLAGAILGHIAHTQIKRTGEEGDGLARSGMIIGWIVTGIALVILAGFIIAFFLFSNNGYKD